MLSEGQITIGSDPEFFLRKNGGYQSSINKIGGSKENPMPLEKSGFFIQEDNVAVEFNVPPASTCQEFVGNIQWAITHIGNKLMDHGYYMAWDASAFFPESELTDPRALIFGCDPDFNAWKLGEVNPRPIALDKNLRTCGGHVHIGYPEVTDTIFRHRLIQAADLHLGVPSCLVDLDKNRNLLYGKPGAFRPTSYGAEYRVLSNFWLRRQSWIEWVYNGMEKAYHFIKNTANLEILDREADKIQDCLQGRYQSISRELMTTYNIAPVPV